MEQDFVEVEVEETVGKFPEGVDALLILQGALSAAEVALSPWKGAKDQPQAVKAEKQALFCSLCSGTQTEFTGNEFNGFNTITGFFRGEKFRFDPKWNMEELSRA